MGGLKLTLFINAGDRGICCSPDGVLDVGGIPGGPAPNQVFFSGFHRLETMSPKEQLCGEPKPSSSASLKGKYVVGFYKSHYKLEQCWVKILHIESSAEALLTIHGQFCRLLGHIDALHHECFHCQLGETQAEAPLELQLQDHSCKPFQACSMKVSAD